MSSTASGMRGGQPSTTQPIAGPWLSPKLVKRIMRPKVLKDIAFPLRRCSTSAAKPGQTWVRAWLRIPAHSPAAENIDDALGHIDERRRRRLCHPEIGHQTARSAAVGDHDRVTLESLVPGTHPV